MHSPSRPVSAVILAGAAFVGTNLGCTSEGDGTSGGSSSGSSGELASSGEGTTPTTGADTGETPTTGGTADATTGGEPLTRVEQILAGLDVAMYECPERVWPDVEDNYRARQVVLASESENMAWVWNYQGVDGEPPVVTKGPLDSLPPEWTSYFNVGFLGVAPAVGISLDATQENNDSVIAGGGTLWPDYASVLAYHEGFHFLSDQDDWSTGGGSRSAPYPAPWEPRYLRAQLKRALLAEAQGEDKTLAAAAYWHGRLLAEHGEEMGAIRSYDCTEGSAEYVALMMSALAELGCEASDEELLALATSHLADGIFVDATGFDVGREPYDLGVLAGLILRGSGAQGWELKVEKGDAPADQLLAGVSPADQPEDPALEAEVEATIAENNMKVGLEIEPLLAHMKDPAYTRIVVSQGWIEGSFGLGGFYYLADDPLETDVWLTFSATLTPGSAVVEVMGLTILADVITPCALSGSGSIVLAVPTADITLAGGTATIGSATLAFDGLAVEATMDGDMLPWLCPVDGGGAGAVAPEPGRALHVLREAPGAGQRVLLRPLTQ